jgi:hypothetical protein
MLKPAEVKPSLVEEAPIAIQDGQELKSVTSDDFAGGQLKAGNFCAQEVMIDGIKETRLWRVIG